MTTSARNALDAPTVLMVTDVPLVHINVLNLFTQKKGVFSVKLDICLLMANALNALETLIPLKALSASLALQIVMCVAQLHFIAIDAKLDMKDIVSLIVIMLHVVHVLETPTVLMGCGV